MINKVISGGQSGADMGGLIAAELMKIETGGTAPPGWMTEVGSQKKKLKAYGLREGKLDRTIYVDRTIKNIRDSDGTIIFGNLKERGSALTLRKCKELRKPVITMPHFKATIVEGGHIETICEWVEMNEVEVLNVAGNRESISPGIVSFVTEVITKVLQDANA